jgi:hypothetical protein
MFDVSPVVEAYVKAQHEGRQGITSQNPNQSSAFKFTNFTQQTPHAIHLIDQFCTNSTNMVWFKCKFRIEYLNTANDSVEIDDMYDRSDVQRMAYNGVLTNDDPITYSPAPYNHYYYNLMDVNYANGSGDYLIRGAAGSTIGGKFLTNMPANEICNKGGETRCPPTLKLPMSENDYGTVAFFNCINIGKLQTMPSQANKAIKYIASVFYNSSGSVIYQDLCENVPINGGKSGIPPDNDISCKWIYFGHGLGNFKGRGGTIPANAVGYQVYASDGTLDGGQYVATSRIYDFEIIYDDCRGYEPVRLCWQNRLGAWDYYTFNLKSKKTVKVKAKTYQQLSGTWNEETWRPKDHLGGQRVYTNQATENWTINSDYMDEKVAAWLQELFESSEVYIVHPFDSTNPLPSFDHATYIHKYIEPVLIKTTTYTKKTRANDGLIQYSVKLEKSKKLNIQRA